MTDYRHKVIQTWVEDQRHIDAGQTRPRIFTVTCKDGSQKDIYFRPVAMENLDQFIIYEDITERQQAERKLSASHEMFLTVLDSIEATIYVADMKTHEILFMNKHMVESFKGDLTGKVCWDVFRGESAPCKNCTNKYFSTMTVGPQVSMCGREKTRLRVNGMSITIGRLNGWTVDG